MISPVILSVRNRTLLLLKLFYDKHLILDVLKLICESNEQMLFHISMF